MEGTDPHVDGPDATPQAVTPVPIPTPPKPPKDPLVSAIRSMRRWIIALTVLVMLVVGLVGAVAAYTFYDTYGSDYAEDPGMNPAMVQPIKDSLTGVLKDDLATVRVYQVEVGTLDDPEEPPNRPYVVVYTLREPAVTIEGLVEDVSGLGDSGLTPTSGPLDRQLSMAEFKTLAGTWAQRTSLPMGYVYSYASAYSEEEDYEPDQTISVGGNDYAIDDLWCVNDGWAPAEGSRTKWDDVPDVQASVFLIDHDSGTFTYVGSEPAQTSAYEGDYEGDY